VPHSKALKVDEEVNGGLGSLPGYWRGCWMHLCRTRWCVPCVCQATHAVSECIEVTARDWDGVWWSVAEDMWNRKCLKVLSQTPGLGLARHDHLLLGIQENSSACAVGWF
jgi:hypothetical protein